MSEIPIPANQVVTVMVAQTTFAVLTMPGRQFRVDFLDKAEARLKPGMSGEFALVSEHPLLLTYNSSLVSVYINSKPQNPQQLDVEIQERIEARLQGWRDFSTVLYPQTLRRNLLDGSGILLQAAPMSIAQDVIDTCAAQGVSTWATPPYGHPQDKQAFQLLLVGKGHVIARGFRFTQL
ncbi:MAG TPA: hypothetical protein VFO93_22050 [Hymenobacter sp.]|uniref:hypothetical protein n=1 Tax=Hymenobacter sp. TaxID=1898978 RepID=UPI002D7FCB1C|nr:hypothetical protein [Hymenobacter sp.]HET9506238.1 hypothetical protein [Hymenobacter sp.]